ncbi:MAG: hypothetical protein V3R87_06370 [Dehalococcoidia bacterium]
MNSFVWCLKWILLLASVAFLLGVPGVLVATAQGSWPTRLTLEAPSEASVGDVIEITASIFDSEGVPITGAPTRFYSYAAFLSGSTGYIEIGEAITDDEGVAAIEYVPTRNGDIEVTAKYEGDDGYLASQGAATIAVDGNRQLYEAHAGLTVPFINVGLLIGILAFLWGTLLFTGILILKIALAPPE